MPYRYSRSLCSYIDCKKWQRFLLGFPNLNRHQSLRELKIVILIVKKSLMVIITTASYSAWIRVSQVRLIQESYWIPIESGFREDRIGLYCWPAIAILWDCLISRPTNMSEPIIPTIPNSCIRSSIAIFSIALLPFSFDSYDYVLRKI